MATSNGHAAICWSSESHIPLMRPEADTPTAHHCPPQSPSNKDRDMETCPPHTHCSDLGHNKRTGNLWTTSAHIITAVIGSGVLSLAWSMAQMGWVLGIISMILFSVITYYTCILLADCYRSPDPVTGRRNVNYTQAVGNILGGRHAFFCSLARYTIMVGSCIGLTITASTSTIAILELNCHHRNGDPSLCTYSENTYIMLFGSIQIVLSQIPDFHQLWWLSIVASIMSFSYASIGVGFSISKVIENGAVDGTIMGLMDGLTPVDKVWRVFQAIGDVAFAYAFSQVFFEIQDTIKSPPQENKTMKAATLIGSCVTTFFYVLCGCAGYAAFGDNAPGNLLTEFNSSEPYWLLAAANAFVVIHILGAYQVICQPVFAIVEHWLWSFLFEGVKPLDGKYGPGMSQRGSYRPLYRFLWRTLFVLVVTNISMFLPFFNDVLGIVGALSFWPLGVFFPIEMHFCQGKVEKWSRRWCLLRSLSLLCLVISLMVLLASLVGVIQKLRGA